MLGRNAERIFYYQGRLYYVQKRRRFRRSHYIDTTVSIWHNDVYPSVRYWF